MTQRLLKPPADLSFFFSGFGLGLQGCPCQQTEVMDLPLVLTLRDSTAHIHPASCVQTCVPRVPSWNGPKPGQQMCKQLIRRDNCGTGYQSMLCFIYQYGPNLRQLEHKSHQRAPKQWHRPLCQRQVEPPTCSSPSPSPFLPTAEQVLAMYC